MTVPVTDQLSVSSGDFPKGLPEWQHARVVRNLQVSKLREHLVLGAFVTRLKYEEESMAF